MNEALNSSQASNEAYVTDTIMSLRLDCEKVLGQLRAFLNGTEQQIEVNDKGEDVIVSVRISAPKANAEGVYSIMSWLNTKFNTQVVQGFFPSDKYGHSEKYVQYIDDVHESLIDLIFNSAEKWEIKDTDAGLIIDTFMQMVKPFISRLIGDRERQSYSQSMRVSEHNTVKEASGFNIFKKSGD